MLHQHWKGAPEKAIRSYPPCSFQCESVRPNRIDEPAGGRMKRWIVGIPFVALLCTPLRAQNQEPNCDGNPEPPRAISERNEPPEFLNWGPGKQGDCTPEVGVGRPGGISIRRLAHKPSNKGRKEFHLGIQDWQKGRSDQALLHLSEACRLDPGDLGHTRPSQRGRASGSSRCTTRAGID